MKQTRSHCPFEVLPDDASIRLSLLVIWGLIPFSRSTLWRRVRARKFPRPLRSANVTFWRVRDIRAWLKDPEGYIADDVEVQE